jgi:hypothetical protein
VSILVDQMEKLYSVSFIEYTNYSKDTVWSEELDKHEHASDLVIKESDLDYWRKFGKGIESLKFVGYLGDPTNETF